MAGGRFECAALDKLAAQVLKAFTGDAYVGSEDFLCALAVARCKDRALRRRLLFRVYEGPAGQLQRARVEALLLLAYGQEHAQTVRAFAEQLFRAAQTPHTLQLRELEAHRGPVELLGVWVFRLLDSLLDAPPPLLSELEKKYSSVLGATSLVHLPYPRLPYPRLTYPRLTYLS